MDQGVRAGTHAVEEALRAGHARALLLQIDLQRRERIATLAALARQRGVPVHYVPAATLDRRAGHARHQGAVAEVGAFHYARLEDFLAQRKTEPSFFLALDGVQDPQNFGAILRSADAAGVHGVVVAERRSAPITPVVARASAGAVDFVPVAQVVNLSRALESLKERGIWVYGLDGGAAETFYQVDCRQAVALVVGAEGAGLSRLVREKCDALVRIPMYGHVASLNVSVAASLALFAVRHGREARPES